MALRLKPPRRQPKGKMNMPAELAEPEQGSVLTLGIEAKGNKVRGEISEVR